MEIFKKLRDIDYYGLCVIVLLISFILLFIFRVGGAFKAAQAEMPVQAQEKKLAYEMKCVLTGPNFRVYQGTYRGDQIYVTVADTGVQPLSMSVVK